MNHRGQEFDQDFDDYITSLEREWAMPLDMRVNSYEEDQAKLVEDLEETKAKLDAAKEALEQVLEKIKASKSSFFGVYAASYQANELYDLEALVKKLDQKWEDGCGPQ